MQGQYRLINSTDTLHNAIAELTELYEEHRYVRAQYKTGKDRTLDQNALSFQIYGDLKRWGKFESVNEARAHCKLHYGVPIARTDPDFSEKYDGLIKHRFNYEEKLALMLEPFDFPVTRGFTRQQFSEYVEAIKRAFPDVRLTIDIEPPGAA